MKLNKMAMAALAMGGMTAFSACDNIDENDRFIPVEKPVVPIEEVTKTLLVMDFTGDNCSNCPEATKVLHSVQEEYTDNVIVVGLHPRGGGELTKPLYGQNFRSKAAQAIFELYDVPTSFPYAIFNGKEKSSEYNQWYTLASGYMGQIANMSIKAQCDYTEASRELTVDYSINMTHDISSEKGYGVMVWVMENNITGPQMTNSGLDQNYVHNHVLRASLSSSPDGNGDNGVIIGKEFKAEDSYRGSASITLDEKWNAENCQVVVYMYNADNNEVEQSVLADVISNKVVEDPHKVPQNLLVMDFTGDNCSNCPNAASMLHDAQEAYPGKVVVVGLHPRGGGELTKPLYGQNFRSSAAQAIFELYNVPTSFPFAIFNGTEKSSEYNQWFTLVTSAIESQTNMTINASTAYEPESRELSVDYFIDFTEDVAEDVSVMVWVMENNITGPQMTNSGLDQNYVHNHVLRASMNGDNGESLGSTFANGQTVKGSASVILHDKDKNEKDKDTWVAENCQVVVYTFNKDTKAVLQCAVANVSVPSAE